MDYLKAVLLGIVEGITEFLPISSTGHMILVEDLLKMAQPDKFITTFMIVIQLPAILSVVVYFWNKLWPWSSEAGPEQTIRMWTKVVVAFLPAVVLGVLLDDLIESYLFNPGTVAAALGVGGVILIVLERRRREPKFDSVHEVSYPLALGIGFFQCLAMIPGTSRSAATIIGAMALGASRSAAAEFSFFLAIPTMLGATTYKLLDSGLAFTGEQWALLGVGSVVSFVVAYAVIAVFMRYIQRHTFEAFGVYRIVLAIAVVAALWMGWLA